MKKKVLFIGLALAAITAAFQSDSQKKNLESLMLENVEALASGEWGAEAHCYGSGSVDCPVTHVKVYFVGDRSFAGSN